MPSSLSLPHPPRGLLYPPRHPAAGRASAPRCTAPRPRHYSTTGYTAQYVPTAPAHFFFFRFSSLFRPHAAPGPPPTDLPATPLHPPFPTTAGSATHARPAASFPPHPAARRPPPAASTRPAAPLPNPTCPRPPATPRRPLLSQARAGGRRHDHTQKRRTACEGGGGQRDHHPPSPRARAGVVTSTPAAAWAPTLPARRQWPTEAPRGRQETRYRGRGRREGGGDRMRRSSSQRRKKKKKGEKRGGRRPRLYRQCPKEKERELAHVEATVLVCRGGRGGVAVDTTGSARNRPPDSQKPHRWRGGRVRMQTHKQTNASVCTSGGYGRVRPPSPPPPLPFTPSSSLDAACPPSLPPPAPPTHFRRLTAPPPCATASPP